MCYNRETEQKTKKPTHSSNPEMEQIDYNAQCMNVTYSNAARMWSLSTENTFEREIWDLKQATSSSFSLHTSNEWIDPPLIVCSTRTHNQFISWQRHRRSDTEYKPMHARKTCDSGTEGPKGLRHHENCQCWSNIETRIRSMHSDRFFHKCIIKT